MKAKLIFLLLLTVLLSLFLTPKTPVNTLPTQPTGTGKFPIGCIESTFGIDDTHYDELGINFTHQYSSIYRLL